MARAVTLRPPAKINLTLRVGAKAANGFHDVHTIMQAIDLTDTLTFTARRGPFVLQTNAKGVPTDASNLVWRAAQALWGFAGPGGEPRDVHVKLDKAIPVAAGLGGGSADAAAALVGLNTIWNFQVSRPELMHLAADLGSDVPFFLVGGTAIGTGRGDEVFPLQDVRRLGVIIIKPSFGVKTADAYRWLDEDRAAGLASPDRPPSGIAVGWPASRIRLVNDLEAPVLRRHAGVGDMIGACARAGALAAAMTGSGSAVFGLFSRAAVPKAARQLRRSGWLVRPTRTLSRAESERRMGL